MDIGVPSLIHERVLPLYVGRVYSLWRQFAEAGIAVGLLVGGPLVDGLGPRAALVVFGGYAVLVALAFLVLVGRQADRRSEGSVREALP
jgi:predicted MFS family arabinose efflux permease